MRPNHPTTAATAAGGTADKATSMAPAYLDEVLTAKPRAPVSDTSEFITLDAVDSVTGLKVGRLTAEVDKPRYDFKGGRYKSVGILMESTLLEAKVPALDMRIALWMPSVCDRKTNEVLLSLKAVRKRFPTVDKSSLSKSLKRLAAMDLLDKDDEFSHYTISPDYAWMGSAKEHRIATVKWRGRMVEKRRKAAGLDTVVEWPEDQVRSA